MTISSFRPARLSFLALLAALPLIVSGCAQTEERRITFATWKQAAPVPQARLAEVPIHHAVAFRTTGGALSDTEREALSIFLRRNSIAPGGRVTLSAAMPSGANAAELGARLTAVRNELANLGYPSATLPPGTSAGAGLPPDAVVVTARVLAVAAVPCPGYNVPIQLDLEHRPILSPGCATAVNFGLMVANPADLQTGQPLSPADGQAVVPSIERYRANEVWPASNSSSGVPFRESTSSQ